MTSGEQVALSGQQGFPRETWGLDVITSQHGHRHSVAPPPRALFSAAPTTPEPLHARPSPRVTFLRTLHPHPLQVLLKRIWERGA